MSHRFIETGTEPRKKFRTCAHPHLSIDFFKPPLTSRHVAMMMRCPYEDPGCIETRADLKTAKQLETEGLLEHDATTSRSRGRWRCTALGESVIAAWRDAGWGELAASAGAR